MNGLDLLADEIDGRLYAAVVHKGVLYDLYTDAAETPVSWASFYLGKVVKIDAKLDAAFVDIGNGQLGFLPAKHIRHPGADESETRTGVTELLTNGQMLLVQVKSEAKITEHEAHKLPRLTMKLYVPGLFLAYSPTSSQVTISRKIENEKTLALTSKLKGKGGWIVQRHADKATEYDIEYESRQLQESWQAILAARAAQKDKPGLLKAGPNALFRALTDYGAINFEHIYVGNKKLLDLATSWSAEHLPALATSKRLRLYKPEQPGQKLFDIHDIFAGLESLQDGHVHLQGGGSIIIEPTAAIMVIDVNQGGASNISGVNQSAAREIARQCRLRNMSGAILIDFINMDQREERSKLLDTLADVFENDLANAQVHGFTRLGIIELTRKRRTATLAEKLKKPAL
jgi:ribonuclease G